MKDFREHRNSSAVKIRAFIHLFRFVSSLLVLEFNFTLVKFILSAFVTFFVKKKKKTEEKEDDHHMEGFHFCQLHRLKSC